MMHVNDRIRSVYIVIAIICNVLALVGCGGGGGGGGDNPVAPTPTLPDTPLISLKAQDLAAPGTSSDHAFNQGALALGIPTSTKRERYAVLLSNGGMAGTIKINGGGSSKLNSARSSIAVVTPMTRPICGTPFVQKIRKNRNPLGIRGNMLETLRASTKGEVLGSDVIFNVTTDGYSYSPRKGVLRRIGKSCKLFVDPEPYNGLSAVIGNDAITEDQLNTIVASFDETIYPLMENAYGTSYDIDNDGKVAIYFSPFFTQNNFAGLFDTENYSDSPNSNRRNMFYIWTPGSFPQDQWLAATCETITHEFQHLVNFSNRLKMKGYDLASVVEEESWLDEALSVGAEIRYRLLVGDPATEGRFKYYMDDMSATSLTSFHNSLADYGCVGLFAQYLLDQGGADRIKKLVISGLQGKANIVAAFSDHGTAELRTFEGIYKNWTKAVFAEMNRRYLDMSAVPSYQKYSLDFDLDRSSSELPYGSGAQEFLSGGALSMFILEPSAGYTADSATLYLQAVVGSTQQTSASIDCTVMRLNDAR